MNCKPTQLYLAMAWHNLADKMQPRDLGEAMDRCRVVDIPKSPVCFRVLCDSIAELNLSSHSVTSFLHLSVIANAICGISLNSNNMADYNTHQTRHIDDAEHRLQVACVRWFRLQHRKIAHSLFAVPNGGRRDAVTGAKLKAEGVVAGVADLILMQQRGGYGALCIEMKTKTGRQSQAQSKWQGLVEHDGYQYAVCRSVEDFINTVTNYLES